MYFVNAVLVTDREQHIEYLIKCFVTFITSDIIIIIIIFIHTHARTHAHTHTTHMDCAVGTTDRFLSSMSPFMCVESNSGVAFELISAVDTTDA